MPRFDFLVFHPHFEDHQTQAGRRIVTMEESQEAWYGERTIVRNRKGRRALYLVLGGTGGDRDITVVVLATAEEGTWLAYTAWDTKQSDR